MSDLKLYAIQIDEHTMRRFRTGGAPPVGAVEIEREPEEDERLSIKGGKPEYKKIPKSPKQPSLRERIEVLEAKLK